MSLNRRHFVKNSFMGAAGLCLIPSLNPFQKAFAQTDFEADVEIILTAKSDKIPLLSGKKTLVMRYEAELIKGHSSVVTSSNGFGGPTLRLRQGQKIRVIFQNHLEEKSIIHWHGLHLEEKYDSHPSYSINPKESFVYEFVVNQRPGTYWYHPHPHGRTAYQIYHGLAGMLIIEGGDEYLYNLPSNDFDLNFCIQDRLFGTDNQLSYLQGGGHDLMMGMMGDTLFVNGERPATQNVLEGGYRLRVLNGSNARLYKLAWSDGDPLTIIGNDGGLLSSPQERQYLYLAPGERIDLYRNFNGLQGQLINLQSIPFQQGQGDPFTLIPFQVTFQKSPDFELPKEFSEIRKLDAQSAVNYDSPKQFTMEMTQGKGWTIDGLSYSMKSVRKKETVKLNTMEIWEFENKMGMPHPVHIHGSQFQVLNRSEGNDPGFMDDGWKDTILIAGGEKIQIIKRFDDYKGYFPFHCHNLEHGSMGMMRDFRVI